MISFSYIAEDDFSHFCVNNHLNSGIFVHLIGRIKSISYWPDKTNFVIEINGLSVKCIFTEEKISSLRKNDFVEIIGEIYNKREVSCNLFPLDFINIQYVKKTDSCYFFNEVVMLNPVLVFQGFLSLAMLDLTEHCATTKLHCFSTNAHTKEDKFSLIVGHLKMADNKSIFLNIDTLQK